MGCGPTPKWGHFWRPPTRDAPARSPKGLRRTTAELFPLLPEVLPLPPLPWSVSRFGGKAAAEAAISIDDATIAAALIDRLVHSGDNGHAQGQRAPVGARIGNG